LGFLDKLKKYCILKKVRESSSAESEKTESEKTESEKTESEKSAESEKTG